MKKLAIVFMLVFLIGGIFSVAALSDVVIGRNVGAMVASDIHGNVAVKFEVLNNYDTDPALATITNYNKIEFDLGAVLTVGGEYFNTEARFVIGKQGAGGGVFTITNQTNQDIIIALVDAEGDSSYIDLLNVEGSVVATKDYPDTIAPGETSEYHFQLDTSGLMTGEGADVVIDLSSVLEIRLVPLEAEQEIDDDVEIENSFYVITSDDGLKMQENRDGWLIGKYSGSAKNIVIPLFLNGETIKEIGQDSFDDTGLIAVSFSNNSQVTAIQRRAFRSNELTEIELPNSLETIGKWAFRNNNDLTKLVIGADVSVGNEAFHRDNKFREFYENHGKLAGTYLFVDGEWVKE